MVGSKMKRLRKLLNKLTKLGTFKIKFGSGGQWDYNQLKNGGKK